MEQFTPGKLVTTSPSQLLHGNASTPSAMVAVPSGLSTTHQVPGGGGAAALTLPVVSLRKATTKQIVQWNVAFNNIVGVHGLTQVVNDGGPPSRAAVYKLDSDLSASEVDERYADALREYQQENTKLFYMFASSINLDGEWHAIDMEFIQESFVRDTVRDGNGLLRWFLAKHDIKAPEKQMRLRADLATTKFELNMPLTKLLKTLVDALSLWCKIGDNDKNDPVKLNAYYVFVLEKMPTRPPEANLVRVRVRLAEKVFANAPQLSDVQSTIEDLVAFAKALGIHDGHERERETVLTMEGLPRLTAADNDCTFCDLFGCKAKTDIKLCPCLNASVKIGEGTTYPRDMQCRYIKGARLHLKDNAELKSLKGVKFHVEPPAGGYTQRGGGGGGRGKGYGGRGKGNGGRGSYGQRQAAPLISGMNDMLGGDADDFDAWLDGQMHEEVRMATPMFGGLFGNGGGDGNDDGIISSAVRDAIEEATNSAVDAAFTNATPRSDRPMQTPAPNPALARLPPITPVVNSALTELRAAASASGGGATTMRSKKKDDDDRTSTEIIMEAGAKGLKQDRLLRKKAEITPTFKQTMVRILVKLADMVHDKVSQFTFSQLCTFVLAFYYVIWPNLKPEVRVLLNRFYSKIIVARDTFISGLASRLIGITTTGIILSMRPSSARPPLTLVDDDNGTSGSAPIAPSASAGISLNPRSVSSGQVASSNSTAAMEGRDEDATSSRDSSPLSPIAESPAKIESASPIIAPGASSNKNSETVLTGAKEKAVATFAAMQTEVNTSKIQLEMNRKHGEPCCPSHAGLPANVCVRECGRIWCSACCAKNGVPECDVCSTEKCSSMPTCEDPNVWAPGSIEYSHDLSQAGESNLVAVHTRKISEFALKEGMVMINASLIPSSAVLFDNGATLNCAKSSAGRLIGSFIENTDGDINVGDANSNLYSDGSYLHAFEYIDSSGKSVDTLYRYDATPNVICNILSEPVEVYENGGSFLFNISSGRVWTTCGGVEMQLHMTKNGLGWCKAIPITDAARIRALLHRTKKSLTASIPRLISTVSSNGSNDDGDLPPLDLSSSIEMDSLATSIDMLHLIDPTFTSITLDGNTTTDKKDGLLTIEMETSKDPNVTYLSDAIRVLAEEGAPCCKDRAAFTVLVSDEIKSLSSDELAIRLADIRMAERRTCTSFATRQDESTACCGARFEQMLARLDEITSGKANEMVSRRFEMLKDLYTDKQWGQMHKERMDYLDRLDFNSRVRVFKPFQSSPDCANLGSRSAFTTSAKIDPRSTSQAQTSVDGSKNLINRDLSDVPLTASGPPCELCGWSSIASWRVPAACLLCGMRLCDACHKLHNCVEVETNDRRDGGLAPALVNSSPGALPLAAVVNPSTPPRLICAGCCGNEDEVGDLRQCETCAEWWCDACYDNDTKHWLRCKPEIGRDVAMPMVVSTTRTPPPPSIGMGRPVPLTGLEVLTRLHVVLGHPPIDQMLATLAKSENMRANVVTKTDVEMFVKQGCIQCIIWKMRRSPVKSLVDATPAPIGKKWSYDTLTLKTKTVAGNLYLTRFLDDGSGKKRTYGHSDFTAETLAGILSMHRAWVRPTHGEIWVGRRDGHPSQRAKLFQDALRDGQMHDESTAPYRHEALPVEVTWQHDVPGAMILLSTGPGAKLLRHFEAAFICHEDASNRIVKPRAHGGEAVSSDMLYNGDSVTHANLLYAFWSPVMYLIYPEIRSDKFSEHAKPGAYYGPSRDTESDRYCLIWNGHRSITCDKGCVRVDERQVIAQSSRTNAKAQPFTISPDTHAQLPNFDQWLDPATQKPQSQQLEPSVEDVELDADVTLTDADPVSPFILYLHAGTRRLGEVGHYVRMLTKQRIKVISIDPKRRGYSHNILLPRVFAWIKRLAMLTLCIALIISGPCSPWTPLAMEKATAGRTVLFDSDNPNGIKSLDGTPHPLVESSLHLHKLGFDIARDVHSHGGKVLIEHPAGHGAHSMWPIKGREKHSTLFDTDIFKAFTKDVPGERCYCDQCMFGADTRKTTQWYCNEAAYAGASKYLSVQCSEENTEDHPYPHTASLVGKDEHGAWKSKGSETYKPPLCRAIALAILDGFINVTPSTTDDPTELPTTDHTVGGGDDHPSSFDGNDNGDDGGNNGDDGGDNGDGSSSDDDPDTPDEAFAALKDDVEHARLTNIEQQHTPSVNTPMPITMPIAPDPPDPFPSGSKVKVFWKNPDQWHTGVITDTSVWRGAKGQSRNPRRHISITYDVDGESLVHSLHETEVRLVQINETDETNKLVTSPPPPIDDAAPGSPRPRPSTPVPRPQTPPRPTPNTNSRGDDEPSFLPSHYKVLKEGSSGFVHHGEKVIAIPDDVYQPLQADEEQAQQGDVGTSAMVTVAINHVRNGMIAESRYSECVKKTHDVLAYNSDLITFASHEFDIELGDFYYRRIVSTVVCGEEVSIDPDEPKQWHTPKNERDYLRSPQRAMWRTAKEKKMDQYMALKVFKLVKRADVKSRVMGSLWAYKIKFNDLGKFDKLNPRWCVKGYHMDKSVYVGFSEVCMTSSIKLMAALLATYSLHSFLFDCGNAFQATRTDNGTVRSEKLYCEQAPGFNIKGDDGESMVCEILVALQGRVDAARLFGDRLEQIIFKLGGKRSTWDPKVYIFHFGPLVDSSASLDKVLEACSKKPNGTDKNGAPYGWATLAVHVDDCPGVGSSTRIIDYIKAGIMVQYECTHGPWKKVLGFNFTITSNSVSMSAAHTIESMYNTYLAHRPLHDARMPGRDVTLSKGEVPNTNDPRYVAYLEMQSETRSLLGLLLWVSLAYPQISYHVNKACGFMSNPSHEVNAFAKHIAMHLYHYPVPVTWGGGQNLELSQPSPPPFTLGAKEYGLHFAADAAPDDAAKGITGGVGMFNGGAIITVSSRQHLASPDMHAYEVLAAGTIMHKIVPIRGLLTEWRISQEHPTPLYIDSASTVFVAQSRGAVKKSAWIRRRAEVLQEAFDMGECDPRKIEEYNNFSDPQTKYLVYKVWMRHLHYTHNMEGEPPPPIEKVAKSKGPSTSAVLCKKAKEKFMLSIGL